MYEQRAATAYPTEWADYAAGIRAVVVKDGVTSISRDAFWGCANLTTVYYSGTKEQWNAVHNYRSQMDKSGFTIWCSDGYNTIS